MDRDKVKIIYNPYEKVIAYKRWDCDDANGNQWKDLGSNSKLIKNKEFIKATIQQNAYEIVGELSEEYNRGGIGLDIVFEGTEEDYRDLKEVVERFYSGKNIKCKRGDYYIDSADVVMSEIDNIFAEVEKLFDKYESEGAGNIISKFSDVTKTTIPICVVGLYSSGKSAFINALIGEEILPSADDPTTARIFKIIESEDTGEISFSVSGESISMLFEGIKYKIIGNIEEDLRNRLHKCLEKIELKSLTRNIYHSLKVINDYASEDEEKDKISQLITVAVPFGNSVLKNNKYNFIIFDTPGSDSESHKEHFDVLEGALREQTNGLPILVTTPTLMDRKGTEKLLDALKGIDGNLDLTNTMIVVNQADNKSNATLEEKATGKVNNILTKWKSRGLYFLSAIVGLGSKKMDDDGSVAWIDRDYKKQFKSKDEFVKSDDLEDYKQLYKYNRIAEDKKNKYLESVSGKVQERDLLYINSGLHCIEQEIVEFAEKYALYNKCSQAQDYLEQAIECTTGQIEKLKQEQETIREKATAEMEENKKDLLDKLDEAISDAEKKFERDYSNHMKGYVDKVTKESIECMRSYIDTTWKEVKESVEWGKRVDEFLNKCESKAKEIKGRCRKKMIARSKEYCESKREDLQRMCCDILKGDENLNDEEKNFLQQFIMDLKLPEEKIRLDNISADDVRQYFLFFSLDSINLKKIIEIYIGKKDQKAGIFKTYTRDTHIKIRDQHIEIFKKWKNQLKNGLAAKMVEMNPKLREEARRIDELQKEITEKAKHKTYISDRLNDLKELFVFKMLNKKEEA